MDFMQVNEEDSKYAFLLGSALRNDDTEQLFVVYDNLIPSSISDCRLERIKEGARYISELPEYDFNALVLNARTFSLASGRSSATGNLSMDSHASRPAGLCLDEDEEGEAVSIMQGEKATTTHYGSLNLQSSLKPTSSKAVDDSLKLDLLGGDQDSGFRGSSSFKANSFMNSISCSESNDDSEDERPGCFDYTQLTQKSRTGEHVRIRHTSNPDYDEDIKVDSSTGGSSVESPRSETSVTHLEYSLTEDIEMQVFSHGSQNIRKGDGGGYPASVTAVNEHQHLYGVHKRNQNDYHEFNSWSSSDTKRNEALRNSYNCCQDPVLGSGSNAGNQKKSRVSMAARGYSKDDSDKVTSPIGLDVNGNPPPALDLGNYQQMRQPVNASKVVEGGSSSLSTLPNHNALTTAQAPLGLEPGSEFGKKRLRKLKRQSKQRSQPSEAVADFKGNDPIEDILSFIEGGENNHKKSPQNIGNNAGKNEKQKKKQEKNNKETLNGQEERTTANSVKPTKSIPSSVIDSSSSAVMGNSTAKDFNEDHSQNITNAVTTTTIVPSSIKKNSVTTGEDPDHNSSEFFDCLNSFPGDDSKKQQKNSSTLDNVQIDLDSTHEFIKQETTVNSRNSKNDAKNSSGVKGNGKKYKNDKMEDLLTENIETSHCSLTKQRTSSFESNDPEPLPPKVSGVKIEDIAAQESTQAFIEVKKKKKRNVPNFTNLDINIQPQNHSYNSKDINSHSYNKAWRSQRPSQSVVSGASSTNNTISSNIVESNKSNSLLIRRSKDDASLDKFSRDLSPSSFPVLMCHTSTPSNVGSRPERRNSCGDINDVKAEVVSETRSYCDSDRESVKSLPAAHNVRAAGESSPLYPVSYATMLVTAQRERRQNPGDSSNSPSSESGIVCGSHTSSIISYHPHSSLEMVSPPPTNVSNDANCSSGSASTPDRKTTVWKGSPRERRHSIGSSPDDKPESDSVNSRHRQKSGSQECLAINLASSSFSGSKEATTKESGSGNSCSSKSPNQAQIVHHNRNSVVKSLVLETAGSSRSVNPRNKSTSITPKIEVSLSSGNKLPASTSLVQSSVSSSAINDNTSILSSQSASEEAGENNPVKLTSVSKKTMTTKQSGSIDATIKKGNSNNTKSVIFLDERFRNSKATDLGITFGFDSSIESNVDGSLPLNKITDHCGNQALSLSSKSSVTSSNPSMSSSSIEQQHQISTSSMSSSNIPASSTISSSSSSSSSISSSLSESTSQHHSDNDNQPTTFPGGAPEKISFKGPHKAGPSNGLVFSPGSVIKSNATNAMTDTQPKLSTNISSATSTNSNSQNSSNINTKVGVISKAANEIVSQSNTTLNTGRGNNYNDKPVNSTNSNSGNLPSQQSTVPHNANEKLEGRKMTSTVPSHPLNNQPHSSHVVPLHPNVNNNPLVMSPPFIGQTVLFSPHFPPPPLHRQVVAMPPLPSATVMDKSSPAITTTVQPSTNPVTANQASSEIPVTTTSSIPTSVTPSPPSSSPSSSNESASVTSPIMAMPSDSKTDLTPIPHVDGPVKVVYGLRINPEGGCGTVFFRPFQPSNKKQRKNNLAELSGLLKKKWTKVKDLQKRGSENYITLNEQ